MMSLFFHAPSHYCASHTPLLTDIAGSPLPVAWPDAWTQATADGLPSAQFEHTLLITHTGVEMLTGKLPTSPKYSWEE